MVAAGRIRLGSGNFSMGLRPASRRHARQPFHAGTSPDSLTRVGDTLFVVGWTASGVLLWHGRRRIEPQVTEAASSGTAVDTVPQGETTEAHGLAALRRNMVRRLERLRHPIPLH